MLSLLQARWVVLLCAAATACAAPAAPPARQAPAPAPVSDCAEGSVAPPVVDLPYLASHRFTPSPYELPALPDELRSLRERAEAASWSGDSKSAHALIEQVIVALSRNGEPDDPRRARLLCDRGVIELQLERWDAAKASFQSGHELAVRALGEAHPLSAELFYGVYATCDPASTSRYFSASADAPCRKALQQALARAQLHLDWQVVESDLRPLSRPTWGQRAALVKASLWDAQSSRSALEHAEDLAALAAHRFGPDSQAAADFGLQLGFALLEDAHLQAGYEHFRRAVAILSRGQDRDTLAFAHLGLADAARRLRRFDEARSELLLAGTRPLERAQLELEAGAPGAASDALSRASDKDFFVEVSSGDALALLGRSQQAEQAFERALGKARVGPDLNAFAYDALVPLAMVRDQRGATADAERALAQALQLVKEEWRKVVAGSQYDVVTERETLDELTKYQGLVDAAISHHLKQGSRDARAAELALESVVALQGLGFASSTIAQEVLAARLSPFDQAALGSYKAAQRRLSEVVLTRVPGADRRPIFLAEADVEAQERALRRAQRRRFEDAAEVQPAALLPAVREVLAADTALLVTAAYRPYCATARSTLTQWGAPRYAAYVVGRSGPIAAFELGEQARIDRAVSELRAQIGCVAAHASPSCTDATLESKQRTLHDLLVAPVEAALAPYPRLIVVPDGALALVPFAALLDAHEKPLGERKILSYAPNARSLLRAAPSAAPRTRAVVVADPVFGAPKAAQGLFADVRPFDRLPGTGVEGTAVARALPGSQLLLEQLATEEAIKDVRGPVVLHVASHGFVLGDPARGQRSDARGMKLTAAAPGAVGVAPEAGRHPMLRSGIVLANANQYGASETSEDGVLTALEATQLQLQGTELVVLSACETGLGEVHRSEGVLGLRRALEVAGARSLLLSLWSVDDTATAALMTSFYAALARGEGRAEALQTAQAEVRSRHPNPYYWASFVLSGDAGPLPRAALAAVSPAAPAAGRSGAPAFLPAWRANVGELQLAPAGGDAAVYVATERELIALARSSGKKLWSSVLGADAVEPLVVVGGAIIFVRNPGAGDVNSAADETLTVLDARTGKLLWQNVGRGFSVPRASGELLVFGRGSTLEARALRDGAVRFSVDIDGLIDGVAIVGDDVHVASTRGDFERREARLEVRKAQDGSLRTAGPGRTCAAGVSGLACMGAASTRLRAIGNGVLAARGDGTLQHFAVGQVDWDKPLRAVDLGGFIGTMLLGERTLYVEVRASEGAGAMVVALSWPSLERLWDQDIGSFAGTLAGRDDWYALEAAGQVVIYDAATGTEAKLPLESNPTAERAVLGDLLVSGTERGVEAFRIQLTSGSRLGPR